MRKNYILGALFCTLLGTTPSFAGKWDIYHSPAGLTMTDEQCRAGVPVRKRVYGEGAELPDLVELFNTIEGRSYKLSRMYTTLNRLNAAVYPNMEMVPDATRLATFKNRLIDTRDVLENALKVSHYLDGDQAEDMPPEVWKKHMFNSLKLASPTWTFKCLGVVSQLRLKLRNHTVAASLDWLSKAFRTSALEGIILDGQTLTQMMADPLYSMTAADLRGKIQGHSAFDEIDLAAHPSLQQDISALDRMAPAVAEDDSGANAEAVSAPVVETVPGEAIRLVGAAMAVVSKDAPRGAFEGKIDIDTLVAGVMIELPRIEGNPTQHAKLQDADYVRRVIAKEILYLT